MSYVDSSIIRLLTGISIKWKKHSRQTEINCLMKFLLTFGCWMHFLNIFFILHQTTPFEPSNLFLHHPIRPVQPENKN
jgi:hypothetical protein